LGSVTDRSRSRRQGVSQLIDTTAIGHGAPNRTLPSHSRSGEPFSHIFLHQVQPFIISQITFGDGNNAGLHTQKL
jgi:hypothetical protein